MRIRTKHPGRPPLYHTAEEKKNAQKLYNKRYNAKRGKKKANRAKLESNVRWRIKKVTGKPLPWSFGLTPEGRESYNEYQRRISKTPEFRERNKDYMKSYWLNNPTKSLAHKIRNSFSAGIRQGVKADTFRSKFGSTLESARAHVETIKIMKQLKEADKPSIDHVIAISHMIEFGLGMEFCHIICDLRNIDVVPKSINSSKRNAVTEEALRVASVLEAAYPDECVGLRFYLECVRNAQQPRFVREA